MFRHERPQKGRLRQFHQLSVEVLGSDSTKVDTEVMAMAWQLLKELGLQASLEINSLGCPACRPSFKEALSRFLEERMTPLCEDCQRRSKVNPLRVLDCKSDNCQKQYASAPSILDHLCSPCDVHFQDVRQGLDQLEVSYSVNSFMVRGLDYYTRSTFELITGDLGAQSAIGAGGRYDSLVRQLGGADVPGIGFAMGMERLIMLLSQQEDLAIEPGLDLFLVAMGDESYEYSFRMLQRFRAIGLRVLMDHDGRSMKKQLKQADKNKARFALILGEDELAKRQAILKNMVSGEQETVAFADNLEEFGKTIQSIIS
jgi:histidyl-tRNA synthetase